MGVRHHLTPYIAEMRTHYARMRDALPPVMRRHLSIAIVCVVFSTLSLFWLFQGSVPAPSIPFGTSQRSGELRRFDGTWDYARDRNNLLLTQGQCEQAFPGLFGEVERANNVWKAQGGVTEETLDSVKGMNGYTRAMVFDQKVCMYPQVVLS